MKLPAYPEQVSLGVMRATIERRMAPIRAGVGDEYFYAKQYLNNYPTYSYFCHMVAEEIMGLARKRPMHKHELSMIIAETMMGWKEIEYEQKKININKQIANLRIDDEEKKDNTDSEGLFGGQPEK